MQESPKDKIKTTQGGNDTEHQSIGVAQPALSTSMAAPQWQCSWPPRSLHTNIGSPRLSPESRISLSVPTAAMISLVSPTLTILISPLGFRHLPQDLPPRAGCAIGLPHKHLIISSQIWTNAFAIPHLCPLPRASNSRGSTRHRDQKHSRRPAGITAVLQGCNKELPASLGRTEATAVLLHGHILLNSKHKSILHGGNNSNQLQSGHAC